MKEIMKGIHNKIILNIIIYVRVVSI